MYTPWLPLVLAFHSPTRLLRPMRTPAPRCCTDDHDRLIEEARQALQPTFAAIDRHTERMLGRVIDTYRQHGVGEHHFAGVDGYGYGDIGRETLDSVYADLFGAEAALVRVQCFSGTHAIACALFGVLRPGDELLGVSGAPYDTLEEVIGLRGRTDDGLRGTLADFGVSYSQVDLDAGGAFDLQSIEGSITPSTKVVHVQRSCGYAWRSSIRVDEIRRLATWLEEHHPSLVLFVDNCYGEFVEEEEPTAVGAHLMAGSLIKNPGGQLALTGGYIAGKAELVAAAGRRLSAPGVEGGATLGQNRAMFQGLFHAPQVVGEAVKAAHLIAHVMGGLGYPCNPPAGSERTDIIQAVKLGEERKVLAFCQAVQHCSPVGAHIKPIAGVTPGYGDPTVFADGTFIDGSTLELSADGPLREPFAVYMQGCTHHTHWAIVLRAALKAIAELGAPLTAAPQAAAAPEGLGERQYAGRRTLKNTG